MQQQLIIFPFGGNGREAAANILSNDVLKKKWDLLGFIDDNHLVHEKKFCGISVLGGRGILKEFPHAQILAVPGNPNNYLERKNIIHELGVSKKKFANIIIPSVTILPDATIGTNILLLSNVVISCGVSIGNHSIILPNTTISHDSKIDDYCCIGSNVTVAGNVHIESNCYIGSGTSIRENIIIKEKSLIGLGSTVVSDVEKKTTMIGNPAKQIKKD